jgi:hypothetical protein
MLTVDHYARIRQLRRDGLTIREIAEQLHHSPKTILRALQNPRTAVGQSVVTADGSGVWSVSHFPGRVIGDSYLSPSCCLTQ